MKNSKIAWTDHTFNPWWGCTKVSEGCKNCYAEDFSSRYGHDIWGADKTRRFFGDKHWNEPLNWNRKAAEKGVKELVFCASMGDVFEDRSDLDEKRLRLWHLIEQTPNLIWLLLTKRPENINRLAKYWFDSWWPSNAWIGATVETQNHIDRIKHLRRIPTTTFVSIEPMLGPVYIRDYATDVNWVIVGGESGTKHRSMALSWARWLRDECKHHGIPFFMKQLGGYPNKRDQMEDFPEDLRIREYPHEAA